MPSTRKGISNFLKGKSNKDPKKVPLSKIKYDGSSTTSSGADTPQAQNTTQQQEPTPPPPPAPTQQEQQQPVDDTGNSGRARAKIIPSNRTRSLPPSALPSSPTKQSTPTRPTMATSAQETSTSPSHSVKSGTYAGGESTPRRKTKSPQKSPDSQRYVPAVSYLPPVPVQSSDTLDDLMSQVDSKSDVDKYRTPTYYDTLSSKSSMSSKINIIGHTGSSTRRSHASERTSRSIQPRTIQPPSMRGRRTVIEPDTSYDTSGAEDDSTCGTSVIGAISTCGTSYSRVDDVVPPTRTRRGRRDHDVMSVDATTVDSYHSYGMWSGAEDSAYHDPNKQTIAWWSIIVMATQFMILLTQLLMCGVSTMDKNGLVGPFPDVFSEWGGKNAYLIIDDEQYFRLASSLFLSVGVVHLIVNAYCTLETAYRYEREWGTPRFIVIYFISGIGGVMTSCVFDPDTIAVSSSGPILGIFGAKFAQVLSWTCFEMDEKTTNLEDVRLDQLGNLTCSMAMLLVLSFVTYVDFSGNMGSLSVGFLAGMFLFCKPILNLCVRFMWGVMLGLFVMLGYFYLIGYLMLYQTETDEDMADACKFFRNLFPEGYDCDCVWN